MKWLGILFGVLTAVIVGVYVLVFTSTGHGIFLPIAVEKIEENTKVKEAKFNEFDLSLNKINMVLDLDGEIIKLNGHYDLFTSSLNLSYDVKIKNLATFEKMIQTPIQGDFETAGQIWGNFNNILVKGKARTAEGSVDYNLNLNDNDLKDINFDLQNISLQKALWMVGQPLYTDAKLFSKGKIKSLNNLEGDIVTIVKNGVLNHPVVKKQFDIDLPKDAVYDLHVKTELKNNKATSIVDFNTFVANIDTTKTVFDLKTGVLTTDYTVAIPSLAKLYFVTEQKMRGDLKIYGDVKFDKKLLATFKLNEFDGAVDGKFEGDTLNVQAKGIEILQLLHMMYYPEIFKSPVNVDLAYNLASKKGTSKISSINGQFLTNETLDMLKKFTSYDLTLEVYDQISLDTVINDTQLANTLLMKSKNTKISSKKLDMDTKKSTIDADLALDYRKYNIGLELSGDIKDPHVSIDYSKAVKDKAKDEVKKRIEKKLGDKMNNQLGDVLKGLF
jgi:hypothetical protein